MLNLIRTGKEKIKKKLLDKISEKYYKINTQDDIKKYEKYTRDFMSPPSGYKTNAFKLFSVNVQKKITDVFKNTNIKVKIVSVNNLSYRFILTFNTPKNNFNNLTKFKNKIAKVLSDVQEIGVIKIIYKKTKNEYTTTSLVIIDHFEKNSNKQKLIGFNKIIQDLNYENIYPFPTQISKILKDDSASLNIMVSIYEKEITDINALLKDVKDDIISVHKKGNSKLDIIVNALSINSYTFLKNEKIFEIKIVIQYTINEKISKKEILKAKKKLLKQQKKEKKRAREQVKKQQNRKKNLQCHNDIEFILQENIEEFEPAELTQIIVNNKTYCFENSSFQNMLKFAKDQKVRGNCKPPIPGKPLDCEWYYPINIGFNVFITEKSYKKSLKEQKHRLWELKNKKVIDFTTGLHIMSEKSGKDNVYDMVPIKSQSGGGRKRKPKKIIVMKKK